MHSILFSLTKPDDTERNKVQAWHTALGIVESAAKQNAAVEPLGRGAWLLTGQDALPVLARMILAAGDWSVPYRVLFVQEATEWKSPKPPE